MVIHYTTTPEDYLAYLKHGIKNSQANRRSKLLSWISTPSLLIAIALLQCTRAQQVTNEAAFLMFLAVLSAIAYPIWYEVWIDSHLKNYVKQHDLKGVVGQITLTITEEDIHEDTETTHSRVLCKDVNRIEIMEEYVHIYVTSLTAAIIPKRVFNAEEYENFKATISEYFNESRS